MSPSFATIRRLANRMIPAVVVASLLCAGLADADDPVSSRRPWLGIWVLELEQLRERLGILAKFTSLPEAGVYIDDVFDPSPASRAGVRRGDFLVAINGRTARDVSAFRQLLAGVEIGHRADLQLVRDGKTLTLTVSVETEPSDSGMR